MTDPSAHSPSEPEDTNAPRRLRDLAGAARVEFEQAGVRPASPTDETSLLEQPGDTIGQYTLIERVGEGGMGTVWAARQKTPVERRVALKVIRLGLESPEVLARFRDEQRSLALMEHPNIAAVLDGSRTPSGRPYFVMEYIEGPPITEYCHRHRLGLRARLQLFIRITSAIEHAHQKGVVHRDIKPSNVLVQVVDGAPFPKVIDFGIARSEVAGEDEHTRWTELQAPIGTLSYMSPEQAGLLEQDVDTRTDVYSLGALLYELITGSVPLDASTTTGSRLENALRALRETDPERPSARLSGAPDRGANAAKSLGMAAPRLREVLAEDLDWITLKALDKDRSRRYPSATALGADVQAFLDGEVVVARPPTWRYRAGKFVRRNRTAVIAAGLILLTTIAGAAGTGYGLWMSLRANRELTEANRVVKRELARASESKALLSEMLTVVAPREARGKDTELLLGILDRTADRLKNGEIRDPEVAAEIDFDVGRSYEALGRLEDGLVHITRARSAAEELYGPKSARALRILSNEALILRHLERIEDSETAFRSVIGGLTQLHGAEHADVLHAKTGLGTLLHRSGRIEEARTILTEAVEAQRRVLDDEERARSSGLLALATLNFFSQIDVAVAKEQFEEALQLAEEHLGPDDPQALRALEHLSQIEAFEGRLDSAIERSASLLERFERVYGPEHRETLGARGNHAVTLFRAERVEESDPLIREVLALQRKVLPEEDPDVLWTEMQVAIHDATAGNQDAAIKRLRRIIDIKKQLGAPPIEEAVNLGIMLRDLGREDEALTVLGEIRTVAEQTIGLQHPTTKMIVELIEAAPPGNPVDDESR